MIQKAINRRKHISRHKFVCVPWMFGVDGKCARQHPRKWKRRESKTHTQRLHVTKYNIGCFKGSKRKVNEEWNEKKSVWNKRNKLSGTLNMHVMLLGPTHISFLCYLLVVRQHHHHHQPANNDIAWLEYRSKLLLCTSNTFGDIFLMGLLKHGYCNAAIV